MKKTLLFTGLLVSLTVKAQITVTTSSFPTAGSNWAAFHDSRQGVHTITPASGTAQTWNYANAFVIDDTSFLAFLNASSTPYASSFPGATLAFHDPVNNFYTYMKTNANGFYVDGLYDANGMPPMIQLDFNPDMLIMPTPFTYGNTRNNNAKVEVIQTGPPNIKIVLTIIQQFNSDAYGTLTTPVYSNQQVIRIKQFQYSVDTTYIDFTGTGNYTYFNSNPPYDSSTVYAFVRNSALPIIMEIGAESPTSTVSTNASYYQSGPTGITENETPAATVQVYPNPSTQGKLHFRFGNHEASLFTLTDLSGRVVYQTSIRGINSLTVYTQSLKNGAYIYHTSREDGKLEDRGKVIVADRN